MRLCTTLALPFLCLGFARPAFPAPLSGDPSGGQDAPDRETPSPAARVGEHRIEMDAYRDFLVRVSGRRPLDTLIDRLLVREEAGRLGIEVSEAEVTASVERAWNGYLERVSGDEERFVAELEASGFHKAEYLANMRDEARHELLSQAVCIATREVTEESIRERFRTDYGVDGDRVEVRQIFLSPARLRADLIAEGTPEAELGEKRLEELCRARLERVLERLAAGEDFAALAAEVSHDLAARVTGGRFAHYNYRAYGPEFAAAVRAAPVGVPQGPIRTEAGFHVIEVLSRVHTELEDVREELRRKLEIEPAGPAEVRGLVDRLRSRVEIETY